MYHITIYRNLEIQIRILLRNGRVQRLCDGRVAATHVQREPGCVVASVDEVREEVCYVVALERVSSALHGGARGLMV